MRISISMKMRIFMLISRGMDIHGSGWLAGSAFLIVNTGLRWVAGEISGVDAGGGGLGLGMVG